MQATRGTRRIRTEGAVDGREERRRINQYARPLDARPMVVKVWICPEIASVSFGSMPIVCSQSVLAQRRFESHMSTYVEIVEPTEVEPNNKDQVRQDQRAALEVVTLALADDVTH